MKWPSRQAEFRPPALGTHGAVSSAHPFASIAGLQMLQRGGNAVDAAVAVGAALGVVEPNSSSAAGVGYMIITPPGGHEPVVLDFVGRAPRAATPEAVAAPRAKDHGMKSAVVPGAVGGWLAALERYGRLDRQTVLGPAICYAEEGFPASPYLSRIVAAAYDSFKPYPTTTDVFAPQTVLPTVGTVIEQPALARTLRLVAEHGSDEFYRGSIAADIVAFAAEHGGLLTADDLAAFEPGWERPISSRYQDHTIYSPAPPCSAVEYLESLALVERLGLSGIDTASPEYVHRLAESFKLSRADRIAYTVAPGERWRTLLSDRYLARRVKDVDLSRVAATNGERYDSTHRSDAVTAGSVHDVMRESTTHFVVMDAEGWVVACTQTIGGGPVKGFGSGVVYGSTGLVMNNFAHWFDLEPASPNVIGPGKRVEMCLSPSQIWRAGAPVAAIGTPGSWGILETTPQLILNLIEHGMSVQAAIEHPRFRLFDGRRMAIESRFGDATLVALRSMGHQVESLGEWNPAVGGAHGVAFDPATGTFSAGADPRRDGLALAY